VKRLLLILLCLLAPLPAFAQAAYPITPTVSAAAEATHVLKNIGGLVYGATATNATSTAGNFMLLNLATAPGNGATVAPLLCVTLPASGTVSVSYGPSQPANFSTGIVAAVSSNASCFTFTSGTITAFLAGAVR
jgi:hypothetical protein